MVNGGVRGWRREKKREREEKERERERDGGWENLQRPTAAAKLLESFLLSSSHCYVRTDNACSFSYDLAPPTEKANTGAQRNTGAGRNEFRGGNYTGVVS